jgi:Xaa-Pro aminopeptidase
MITQAEFAARRARLFELMAPDSIAVVRTAERVERTNDTYFRFRPRSHFYYLTGFEEPEAYAVLLRGETRSEYILFSMKREPDREIWLGAKAGQDSAVSDYGADRAFPVGQLDELMPTLLAGRRRIYYLFGNDDKLHEQIGRWIRSVQTQVRKGVVAPTEILHLESVLQDLRLYKSPAEVALMQRAIDITADGIMRAMRTARPGRYEYELEAEMLHEFTRRGAQASFGGVVTAGINGCLSHYRETNRERMKDGDLVIIDAGAEFQYYTADLSVTFPVNGKFTPEQRRIYELVLAIERKLVSLVRPGVTIGDVQAVVPRMVLEGLLQAGVIEGRLEDLLDAGIHRTFFMHHMGHWLGMDIHDEATYAMPDGTWRVLRPGMVMTVEPGIYIREGMPNVEPRWWNIGARVEDNLLVTESGCEVLSAAIPRAVAEIENLMRNGHDDAAGSAR